MDVNRCMWSIKGPFSSKHQHIVSNWGYLSKRSFILFQISISLLSFLYKTFRTRRLQKTGLESPGRPPSPRKLRKTSHYRLILRLKIIRIIKGSRHSEIVDCSFRGEGGSGLGLHLVYNLVTQALNGKIQLDSTLGHGIRISINFPVIVIKNDQH